MEDFGVYGNKSDSSLPRIPSEGLDSSEDLRHTGRGPAVAGWRQGNIAGVDLGSRSAKIQAVDDVLMGK